MKRISKKLASLTVSAMMALTMTSVIGGQENPTTEPSTDVSTTETVVENVESQPLQESPETIQEPTNTNEIATANGLTELDITNQEELKSFFHHALADGKIGYENVYANLKDNITIDAKDISIDTLYQFKNSIFNGNGHTITITNENNVKLQALFGDIIVDKEFQQQAQPAQPAQPQPETPTSETPAAPQESNQSTEGEPEKENPQVSSNKTSSTEVTPVEDATNEAPTTNKDALSAAPRNNGENAEGVINQFGIYNLHVDASTVDFIGSSFIHDIKVGVFKDIEIETLEAGTPAISAETKRFHVSKIKMKVHDVLPNYDVKEKSNAYAYGFVHFFVLTDFDKIQFEANRIGIPENFDESKDASHKGVNALGFGRSLRFSHSEHFPQFSNVNGVTIKVADSIESVDFGKIMDPRFDICVATAGFGLDMNLVNLDDIQVEVEKDIFATVYASGDSYTRVAGFAVNLTNANNCHVTVNGKVGGFSYNKMGHSTLETDGFCSMNSDVATSLKSLIKKNLIKDPSINKCSANVNTIYADDMSEKEKEEKDKSKINFEALKDTHEFNANVAVGFDQFNAIEGSPTPNIVIKDSKFTAKDLLVYQRFGNTNANLTQYLLGEGNTFEITNNFAVEILCRDNSDSQMGSTRFLFSSKNNTFNVGKMKYHEYMMKDAVLDGISDNPSLFISGFAKSALNHPSDQEDFQSLDKPTVADNNRVTIGSFDVICDDNDHTRQAKNELIYVAGYLNEMRGNPTREMQIINSAFHCDKFNVQINNKSSNQHIAGFIDHYAASANKSIIKNCSAFIQNNMNATFNSGYIGGFVADISFIGSPLTLSNTSVFIGGDMNIRTPDDKDNPMNMIGGYAGQVQPTSNVKIDQAAVQIHGNINAHSVTSNLVVTGGFMSNLGVMLDGPWVLDGCNVWVGKNIVYPEDEENKAHINGNFIGALEQYRGEVTIQRCAEYIGGEAYSSKDSSVIQRAPMMVVANASGNKVNVKSFTVLMDESVKNKLNHIEFVKGVPNQSYQTEGNVYVVALHHEIGKWDRTVYATKMVDDTENKKINVELQGDSIDTLELIPREFQTKYWNPDYKLSKYDKTFAYYKTNESKPSEVSVALDGASLNLVNTVSYNDQNEYLTLKNEEDRHAYIYNINNGAVYDILGLGVYYEIVPSIDLLTVHFDTDGGNHIQTQYLDFGDKVTRPKDPVKKGYEFEGWYIEQKDLEDLHRIYPPRNEETLVKFDFDTRIGKDITLVAKWKKKSMIVPETGDHNSYTNYVLLGLLTILLAGTSAVVLNKHRS